MRNDNRIFLVGFMGCGKTYWGERLAAHIGTAFVDLDKLIETHAELSVNHLFEQLGEKQFRILEREALLRCNSFESCVIATGGGTPCYFDNMAWMNKHGKTIYLKTPTHILAERLQHERQFRPLLAKVPAHLLAAHIEKLLGQREPYYAQAHATIEYEANEALFLQNLIQWINS